MNLKPLKELYHRYIRYSIDKPVDSPEARIYSKCAVDIDRLIAEYLLAESDESSQPLYTEPSEDAVAFDIWDIRPNVAERKNG